MKICFCVDSMGAGGAEKVVATLSNEFVKKGNDVSVAMISNHKCESFYKLDDKIKLICLCENSKKKIKVFKRVGLLKNLLISINPDIVIAFLPHVCIYTYYALKSTNIPLICSERNDPNQYSLIYKLLIKHIFKRCSGCVFQTNNQMKWYGEKVANKSVVIPNPINLAFIPNSLPIERKKVILNVGRLELQKNQKCLIDAFALFHKNHPDYKLHIYGEGSLKSDLMKQVDTLNLNDAVIFKGNSTTWHKDEYAAAAFVLSSNYEGMPNALAEALALGIPCISTDCPIGGPKDLFYEDKGILVKCNSSIDLCSSLEKIICSDKTFKFDLNVYTASHISNKWYDFIDRCKK